MSAKHAAKTAVLNTGERTSESLRTGEVMQTNTKGILLTRTMAGGSGGRSSDKRQWCVDRPTTNPQTLRGNTGVCSGSKRTKRVPKFPPAFTAMYSFFYYSLQLAACSSWSTPALPSASFSRLGFSQSPVKKSHTSRSLSPTWRDVVAIAPFTGLWVPCTTCQQHLALGSKAKFCATHAKSGIVVVSLTKDAVSPNASSSRQPAWKVPRRASSALHMRGQR